jgi:NAD(P)H-flavin reductase
VPDVPVLVKLTPNVPDIAGMAAVAVTAGAAGVTAINTVGPAVYRHREAGAPILSNPPNGRGGQSGEWVREAALRAVDAIRREVGPDPVIVGMGGVATGSDVAAMRRAGADVVGIGSALARVHQRDWPRYLAGLAASGDGATGDGATRAGATARTVTDRGVPGRSSPLVPRQTAGMDLRRWTVTGRRELGDGLFELDTRAAGTDPIDGDGDGDDDGDGGGDAGRGGGGGGGRPASPGGVFAPGRSVFLWLPGAGEKPFAPAVVRAGTVPLAADLDRPDLDRSDPARPEANPSTPELTFLIRRRGPLTEALGALEPGDPVYLRGPYGDPHVPRPTRPVRPDSPDAAPAPGQSPDHGSTAGPVTLLLGAGSGAAVLPGLAEAIRAGGGTVTTLIGTREPLVPGATISALEGYGPVRVVPDEGVPARVLAEISDVARAAYVRRAYLCGPEPFMSRATTALSAAGIPATEIFLSLERSMRCGVGMCGECHNRGRLTCQYGTIVPATEFDQ